MRQNLSQFYESQLSALMQLRAATRHAANQAQKFEFERLNRPRRKLSKTWPLFADSPNCLIL